MYEIAGGLLLLCLILFTAFTLISVVYAVRTKCIRWQHITLKEGLRHMRAAIRESRGQSCSQRFQVLCAQWDVVCQVGMFRCCVCSLFQCCF